MNKTSTLELAMPNSTHPWFFASIALAVAIISSGCTHPISLEIRPTTPTLVTPDETVKTVQYSEFITARHQQHIKLCVQRNPQALDGGRILRIDFGVTPQGRVNQIHTEGGAAQGKDLAECVSRTLRWIELPPSPGQYQQLRLELVRRTGNQVELVLGNRNSGPGPLAKNQVGQSSTRQRLPKQLGQALSTTDNHN